MDGIDLQSSNTARQNLNDAATQLRDRVQELLDSNHRLLALTRAIRSLVAGRGLDDVLARTSLEARSLARAEHAIVAVVHADGSLDRVVHAGMTGEPRPVEGTPHDDGLLGVVLTSEEPIRLGDLRRDPRMTELPSHILPLVSFLGVPIRADGTIRGGLYLTHGSANHFTAEDAETVGILAEVAGNVIRSTRLLEAANARDVLNTSLAAVNTALLSPDENDILGRVAEAAGEALGAPLIAVVARAPDARFSIEGVRGTTSGELADHLLDGTASMFATAIDSSRPVHLTAYSEPEAGDLAGRPMLAVPLAGEGGSPRLLVLFRTRGAPAFTEKEVTMATEFAGRISVVLALLSDRLERQQLRMGEERARIARDLHDQAIQRLFATGLGLQELASSSEAGEDAIGPFIAELDAVISEIRNAIFGMDRTGPHLDPPLQHRLLDVLASVEHALPANPVITLSGPVDLLITRNLADDVLAVMRETLSNVARHAHARTVVVEVAVTATEASVTVDDDGDGLPSPLHRSNGLDNLAIRAQSHGGSFTAEPRVGGGTRAHWVVPLPE